MQNVNDQQWIPPLLIFTSILSFLGSIILSLETILAPRKTILTQILFMLSISDFLYTCAGLFFTSTSNYQECPWLLTTTREYTRLVSCGFHLSFAWGLRMIIVTPRTESYKDLETKILHRTLLLSLGAPILYIAMMLFISPHEYLDCICWNYLSGADLIISVFLLKFLLILPMLTTFVSVLLLQYSTMRFLKEKLIQEGNYQFLKSLLELLVYPFAVMIAYFWILFDDPETTVDWIRVVNIAFQQMQGIITFLVFGLNYQSRSHIKNTLHKVCHSIKIMIFKKKDQGQTTEIEMELRSSFIDHDEETTRASKAILHMQDIEEMHGNSNGVRKEHNRRVTYPAVVK